MRTQAVNPAETRARKLKTIAKVATGTAVAATAVAATLIAAKKGKLDPVEGGNELIEKFKAVLKDPAEKLLNIITGTKVFAQAAEKVGAIKTKATPFVETVSKKAEEIKTKATPFIEKVSKKAGEIKEGILADAETVIANAEGSVKGFAQKAPTYAQEVRCKTSGLAGKARGFAKKALAFAKDIPTYLGCLALEAKDKVAKFLPEAQQEVSESVQRQNIGADLANALRKVAEKAQQ